jgi:L-iditol 2-dehydrogenase
MVAPGQIEIQTLPILDLEPGAVLLRVIACGVCGTDKHTFRGETKQYVGTEAESDTPFPIVPGHEVVGMVEEINDEVEPRRDFSGAPVRVGDRVVLCPDVICGQCYACRHTYAYPWCENLRGYGNNFTATEPPHLMGGWAEYMYVLPNAFLYKVPDGLPNEQAAWTELMAVSCNLDKTQEFFTLTQGGLNVEDTVVIQGAGPMGIAHVIKARVMGAGTIIVTDYSEFRLDMAHAFGADIALNLGETTLEERIAQVQERTAGRGADVVVECAGVAEAVQEGLEMVRRGGFYIVAGNFVDTGDISINPHRHLVAKNIRLIGMTNHPFTGYAPSMRLLSRHAGEFPFEGFVTHRFGLDQAQQALETSMGAETLKVLIVPSGRFSD